MDFVKDYKEFEKYRLSFNQLAQKTFEIDFEKWFQYGFWNERYIPYSWLNNDQVIANASANFLDFVINGQVIKALQIGTVMTDCHYRKQGLASHLINQIINENEEKVDFIYLFCEEQNIEFYKTLGFLPLLDSLYIINQVHYPEPSNPLKQIDFTKLEDRLFVFEIINNSVAQSNLFSVNQAHHIITWYCTYSLNQTIFYDSELQCVILFRIKDDVLFLYGYFSKNIIPLHVLIKRLSGYNYNSIKIFFTPDEEILAKCQTSPNEQIMFLKSKMNFPNDFCHPMTCRA